MSNALPRGYKNTDKLLSLLKNKDSDFWELQGRRRAIALAEEMKNRVPAYKKMLKQNTVGKSEIKTKKDFEQLPLLTKENYLKKNMHPDLCWDGKFSSQSWVISTTSGSTGEPFYFPRKDEQDEQYAILAELYMRTNFDIENKSTLYIDAFPMGPWIGGVFTYEAVRKVARRGGYKLSIITTGVNKLEIIKAVKRFGAQFDQIIIGCYGPFLKDALDEGKQMHINWSKYNIKFVFSAEGFTEKFRDYVLKTVGSSNYLRDSLNHYGIVDLGTTSYETPLAILIRRLASKNKKLLLDLFGSDSKLPTLTQYIPALHYFEDIDGKIVCSAYSGLPLVRYDTQDHGGIIRFNEMIELFKKHDIDLIDEAKKNGIFDTVWQLPFVYIFERRDFSVSLYAFRIYPQTIRKALLDKKVQTKVTGKFTMEVKYDKNKNQFLEINVELKNKVGSTKQLHNRIRKTITNYLCQNNSEYNRTYVEMPRRVTPRVILWNYEDSTYFKPGIKQQWVKK